MHDIVVFVLKCQQQLRAVRGFHLQMSHQTRLVVQHTGTFLFQDRFSPVPGDSCCVLHAVILDVQYQPQESIHCLCFLFS